MAKHILSKSTFIRGLQCHKSLFMYKYHPEKKDVLSAEQLAKFQRGHDVGNLAQQLFPGGIDARGEGHLQVARLLETTQRLIREGATIIYEAGLEFDGCLAIMDILVREGDRWTAHEVKSSVVVKDVYRMDAAYQYYVISNSGLRLDDVSIVYPVRPWEEWGEEPVATYFTSESVLGYALAEQEHIKKEIMNQKMMLQLRRLPYREMGEHCLNPYPCDFRGFCSAGQ